MGIIFRYSGKDLESEKDVPLFFVKCEQQALFATLFSLLIAPVII